MLQVGKQKQSLYEIFNKKNKILNIKKRKTYTIYHFILNKHYKLYTGET